MSNDPTSIESVNELYEFLQGLSMPEGMTVKDKPKLSSKKAMSVIWFIQEHMRLLPDHYERCDNCGELFDDHKEGHYDEKNGRHTCGGCE